MRLVALAAAALIATGPAAAADSPVDAARPDTVVDAVREAGFRAQLTEDDYGDPMIETSMAGVDILIIFYDCQDHAACESLQLSAGFDRENPMLAQRVEEWNAARRFGTVSLDEEGDPYLRWDVITKGGISFEAFESTLRGYESTIGEFATFVFEDDVTDADAVSSSAAETIRL